MIRLTKTIFLKTASTLLAISQKYFCVLLAKTNKKQKNKKTKNKKDPESHLNSCLGNLN